MTTTSHIAAKRSYGPTSSFGNAGPLGGIFNPKTVVILGASEQRGTEGQKTLSALMSSELWGRTFVVQPEQSTVMGKTAYPSLNSIPDKMDLAVAVTPPETAPDVLAECVEKEVKGVILISSGFGVPGGDCAEAVERMRAILRGSRTRVIGPNSLGVMNPLIGLNATLGLQMPIGGTVAFLSESPLLGRFVLDWSFKHIVGFSAFASLGTMLDVSWANLIDYFGRDPRTRTIVIQISSTVRPARLSPRRAKFRSTSRSSSPRLGGQMHRFAPWRGRRAVSLAMMRFYRPRFVEWACCRWTLSRSFSMPPMRCRSSHVPKARALWL